MERVISRLAKQIETENHHSSRTKKGKSTKHCNICGNKFTSRGEHILFCNACRKNNKDVLRFSDWLPEGPEGVDIDDIAA